MTSPSRGSGALRSVEPPRASPFEERERQRHEARIARLDALARRRLELVDESRYYGRQIQRLVENLILPGSRVLDVGCGFGDLLASLGAVRGVGIDISPATVALARARHPELDLRVADVERDVLPEGPFDFILLSDVLGYLDDIQRAIERLRPLLAPGGRLIVTYYSFLWEPVIKVAEALSVKAPSPDQNWLSMQDIETILHLTSFEVVRRGTDVLVPVELPLVSELANKVGAKLPVVRHGSLVQYFVAKASPRPPVDRSASVTVVCPCKNERGNIRDVVERTPLMGPRTELIFVDGSSTDGTVEEIEAVIRSYRGPLSIRLIPQGDGKGKGDAVRKGFEAARNDVLMILDADLTVPPEDLPRFYDALVEGKGDFINGVRLVYPMEGEAMRFLNILGNKFFSVALSWLLEQPIKDSLCGTKVLYRADWERITEHRHLFESYDPFGDFDLLFGAARCNMKIVDVLVRYRARLYGETKIHRFRDGWRLLRMTASAFERTRLR